MGTRGPVPKRIDQRLGHVTKAQKSGVVKVQMAGEVKPPATPSHLHKVAKRWLNALKASGQAQFFEPSDWAAALYVAEAMTQNLEAGRFSAQLFGAVWSAMEDMLTTEAARRRVRLEVERALDEEGETSDKVADIDHYRELLG